MTNQDVIKVKIAEHQEIRKSQWTAMIVLIGGIATLLVTMDSLIKFILFIIGGVILILLINAIIYSNNQISKLISFLDKEV